MGLFFGSVLKICCPMSETENCHCPVFVRKYPVNHGVLSENRTNGQNPTKNRTFNPMIFKKNFTYDPIKNFLFAFWRKMAIMPPFIFRLYKE